MTDQLVRAEFAGRLVALLLPTAWENREFTPDAGVLWVRPTLLPGVPEPQEIGPDPLMHQVGIYQIDVFSPAGAGPADAEDQAAIIAAAYQENDGIQLGAGMLYIDRVYCRPALREDAWYIIPVIVEWRAITV